MTEVPLANVTLTVTRAYLHIRIGSECPRVCHAFHCPTRLHNCFCLLTGVGHRTGSKDARSILTWTRLSASIWYTFRLCWAPLLRKHDFGTTHVRMRTTACICAARSQRSPCAERDNKGGPLRELGEISILPKTQLLTGHPHIAATSTHLYHISLSIPFALPTLPHRVAQVPASIPITEYHASHASMQLSHSHAVPNDDPRQVFRMTTMRCNGWRV